LDYAIVVFSRDPDSGYLDYMTRIDGGYGQWQPTRMVLSPDGTSLYALSRWSVLVLARDSATSLLTFVEEQSVLAFGSLTALGISGGGEFVYACGTNASTSGIAVFGRDSVSGQLNLVQFVADGDGDALGLRLPQDIVVMARSVLVSSAEGSIAVFDRDPESGVLSFVEANFDGNGGVPELSSPYSLCASRDGRSVYFGGSHQVHVFSMILFSDNFEGGSYSAWSLVVP
jgi:6-phosphogluconolactonase (cycloisomerase 2 family)